MTLESNYGDNIVLNSQLITHFNINEWNLIKKFSILVQVDIEFFFVDAKITDIISGWLIERIFVDSSARSAWMEKNKSDF